MAKKRRKRKPNKKYEVRMHSGTRILAMIGLILLCLVIVFFCSFIVMRALGKSKLYGKNAVADTAMLTEKMQEMNSLGQEDSGENGEESADPNAAQGEAVKELEEGQIFIDGKVYQYNEDILTFLCLGVDSKSGVTKEKTPGKAGQADTILLMVLNPHDNTMKAIALNRDAMTDIELHDTDGNFAGTEKGQLALQYAYGNGRDTSCEMMQKSVSNLLYGIPIHAYAAIDMSTIATLTDAVGGVRVTMPEDLTKVNSSWKEGSEVVLQGQNALTFVRERDSKSKELGSQLKRLQRQKLFLMSFINQAKRKTRADITFPVKLYQDMKDHVVTDLTTDKIAYLAGEVLHYQFDMDSMIHLDGTYEAGDKNEEFYLDEQTLRETILQVFYEEVPE